MKGKELIGDTVNDFEKRRDVAVRYNRGLWVKTIQSMKKVEQIKQKREMRLWKKRMVAAKDKQQQQIEVELQKDLKLVSNETVKQKILFNMEEQEAKKKAKAQARPAKMVIES